MRTDSHTGLCRLGCAAMALALVGCANSPTVVDPGVTRLYVISRVDFVADQSGNAVGVDVDGVTSTGEGASCVDQTADYASVTEPGVDGVDNALADHNAALFDPDGDGPCTSDPDWPCEGVKIGERFAAGEGLVVVEVSGIHEGLAVDDVRVAVHRAAASGAPLLADGGLAPEQSFELELVTETLDATLSGGRLRARFHEPLALHFLLLMPMLPMPPLHDAQLSAELTPTTLRGALGGGVDIEEEAVLAETVGPGYGDAVRDSWRNSADLDPDPSDPTHCRAWALGLGIEAVSAVAR